jgi:hypothetical protein
MRILTISGLFCVALVLSSCLPQTKTEQPAVGRLAMAIVGERSMGDRANDSIGVGVFFKNQETGELHQRVFEFEEGKKVAYFEDLLPGRYLFEGFDEHIFGHPIPRKLQAPVEVTITAGETTLSPLNVHMHAAIYSGAGLGQSMEEDFWDGFNLN